jgi:hypothetical protein
MTFIITKQQPNSSAIPWAGWYTETLSEAREMAGRQNVHALPGITFRVAKMVRKPTLAGLVYATWEHIEEAR